MKPNHSCQNDTIVEVCTSFISCSFILLSLYMFDSAEGITEMKYNATATETAAVLVTDDVFVESEVNVEVVDDDVEVVLLSGPPISSDRK